MEHTLVHLAETAAWVFVIIVIFAVIGVYATIRWIADLIGRGERAVQNEAQDISNRITHRQ